VAGFVGPIINGLVGWGVWSVVTYFVGKSIFAGKGTLEGMLRVLGYASAPNILGILVFIPCIGWLAALAGWLLSLIAGVMAVREGLDLTLGAAIGVVIIGWFARVAVAIAVAVAFGGAFVVGAGLLRLLTGR
jgi:hypothetical protein